MERSKKVKVDMNPKRVKDPNEGNKRSPGKFDQKVSWQTDWVRTPNQNVLENLLSSGQALCG